MEVLQFQSFRVYSVARSIMKPLAISPHLLGIGVILLAQHIHTQYLQPTDHKPYSYRAPKSAQAHTLMWCVRLFLSTQETGVSKFQDKQNYTGKEHDSTNKTNLYIKCSICIEPTYHLCMLGLCVRRHHIINMCK